MDELSNLKGAVAETREGLCNHSEWVLYDVCLFVFASGLMGAEVDKKDIIDSRFSSSSNCYFTNKHQPKNKITQFLLSTSLKIRKLSYFMSNKLASFFRHCILPMTTYLA